MSYAVQSCFCARTDNHSPTRHYSVSAVFKVPIWATQFAVASALVQTSPTRHYPLRTMRCCANLLLSRFPWELTVLPWRLQTFSLWFKTQPQPNCLFESHSDPQVSYQHRALYKLSKYIDELLVAKSLTNILKFTYFYIHFHNTCFNRKRWLKKVLREWVFGLSLRSYESVLDDSNLQ